MNREPAAPGPVEVLFLGTGAADWPAEAPARGAEHRRFSSALVNGRVLIDCGPAVPEALATFGADPAGITDVLLTHSHGDHCSPRTLEALAGRRPAGIRLWADAGALEGIPEMAGVARNPVRHGEGFAAGGLSVTPLPANHVVAPGEQPLHYLIATETRTLLYATDGAWLLKPAWQALQGQRLDAVIWDATIGEVEGDWRIFEHNSLAMLRTMAQTLRAQGALKPDACIVLTHLARTLHPPHAELCGQVAPDGFVPAYDGWRLGL